MFSLLKSLIFKFTFIIASIWIVFNFRFLIFWSEVATGLRQLRINIFSSFFRYNNIFFCERNRLVILLIFWWLLLCYVYIRSGGVLANVTFLVLLASLYCTFIKCILGWFLSFSFFLLEVVFLIFRLFSLLFFKIRCSWRLDISVVVVIVASKLVITFFIKKIASWVNKRPVFINIEAIIIVEAAWRVALFFLILILISLRSGGASKVIILF